MKSKTKVLVAIATCAALTLLPLSVAASTMIVEEQHLYELRTLSGQFEPGFTDGERKVAKHASPSSILELEDSRLLVSDQDNHIIRILDDHTVATFSGAILDFDETGYPIGALNDGKSEEALYASPAGLAADQLGNIYVADSKNHAIRKIDVNGNVMTIAGTGVQGYRDGNGEQAQFNTPSDLVVDEKGNVYVADSLNHVIRKIDNKGVVTTLNKQSTRIVEYFPGVVTAAGDFKDGPLTEALFNEPSSLAVDAKGNIFVSDTGNQRIRYVDLESQEVITIAGGGKLAASELYVMSSYADGDALSARFAQPLGISLTKDGQLLIADSNNHVIRLLHNGKVSTVAGVAEEAGRDDGVLSRGKLHYPTDVIERNNGQLVVADTSNNKLRVVQKYISPERLDIHKINVVFDGQLIASDVDAQLIDGQTYLPLRALSEALGFEVAYDVNAKEATVLVNEQLKYVFDQEALTIKKVTHEGQQDMNDVQGYSVQNRVLVPVRFISEQFGYDVQWDAKNKDVVIRPYIFDN